jgi:hypothetical protein
MMANLRSGFVFLASTKCASTSVEAALHAHCDLIVNCGPSNKHMSWRRAHTLVQDMMTRHPRPDRPLEYISIVRQPMDWVESWYDYRSRNAIKDRAERYLGDRSIQDVIVEEIERAADDPNRIGFQHTMYRRPKGSEDELTLFQFNHLHLLVKYLKQKYGVQLKLDHLNQTPGREAGASLAERISPEVMARAREHWRPDFRLYKNANGKRRLDEVRAERAAQAADLGAGQTDAGSAEAGKEEANVK